MVNKETLALMKPTAVLVNTARGNIIDEEALYQAIKSGKLAGAGIDVFAQEPLPLDSSLLTLENVVLTPHNAGYPSRSSYIATVLEEFGRCFRNEPLRNEVAPEKIAFMTENCVNR